MAKHISIDTETLGIAPDSVVLSLSAVSFRLGDTDTFENLLQGGFHSKLMVKPQLAAGRTVNPDTIQWWKRQGESAREVLTPREDDVTIAEMFRDFIIWLGEQGYDHSESYVWIRGPHFDFPLVKNMWQSEFPDDPLPINTFMVRDVRTAIDMMTGSKKGNSGLPVPEEFVKHNSLHDAAIAAYDIQRLINSG